MTSLALVETPPAEERTSPGDGVVGATGNVRDLLDYLPQNSSERTPRWPSVVTADARLDGHAVGIVANQPRHLGGALNADAASKAARFVNGCDAFGPPLVVLADTPGFLPGAAQEAGGVIRHGAKLVHAFAAASVPRITVVLRKAYGGAFIATNGRDLGADLLLAWPRAQMGVMGAREAVDPRTFSDPARPLRPARNIPL